MSELICDICGTSYPDTEHSCPTCGYARAFQATAGGQEQAPAAREKIRGGRFSKKNVQKRLKEQARRGVRTEPERDAAEELRLAAEQEVPVQKPESVIAPVEEMILPMEAPAAEQPEIEPVAVVLPEFDVEPAQEEVTLPAQEPEEELPEFDPVAVVLPEFDAEPAREEVTLPAEEPEVELPEFDPVAVVLPEFDAEPAREEMTLPVEEPEEELPEFDPVAVVLPEFDAEPAREEVTLPAEEPEEELPEFDPVAVVLPEFDIEPAQEEVPLSAEEPEEELPEFDPVDVVLPEFDAEPAEEEEIIPVILPGETDSEPAPAPQEEKKKKKGGLLLNIVLAVSLTAFVLSALYLLIWHGLPYLRTIEWPTQAVAETTQPTEEPTEALTDAPTEAPTDAPTEAPTDPPTEEPTEPPTDPPTEAPTDPPTEPPTEEPTEPLLDVKLELNHYDLTFGKVGHTTQLEVVEIPPEDITWISDDTSIVTINETGLITAVGTGKTTVRAIYGDQEVTVKIKVK